MSQSSSGVTVGAESDDDLSSDNEKETVDASHVYSQRPAQHKKVINNNNNNNNNIFEDDL